MGKRPRIAVQIERLSFIVTPADRVQEFIDADRTVWEPWLQQQRGYIRKHYQRYADGRVDIRIFWASQRDWDKAAESPEIPALDVRLRAEFVGYYQRLD